MILVGIDDTDTSDSPGTNQIARAIVSEFGDAFHCIRIVRHQLLVDPRVPYTSKNSCCSLLVRHALPSDEALALLRDIFRASLLRRFQPGSDPGLCLATEIPQELSRFGRLCQREVVRQTEARRIASQFGIWLEGLGGTEDGVIGALAAVGLSATNNDGRIVQNQQQPDDLSGPQPAQLLYARGIDQIRRRGSDELITTGAVDVGKHLRPNLRNGRVVLVVEPVPAGEDLWRAIRLP